MHFLVLSPSWPTSKTIDFVFVEQLCSALADHGHRMTVIAPQSITKCLLRGIPVAPAYSRYSTSQGNTVSLYRPWYISLGNAGRKCFKNSYPRAVKRAFGKLKEKPDVCYGHFWQCIFALFPLAKAAGIPLFGASGEEDVAYYIDRPKKYIEEVKACLNGVVCVSSKNQGECLHLGLVSPEKSVVIPNAVDLSLFRKMDKGSCRKELLLGQDDFIVCFVGQFDSRKGTMRLSAALKQIDDPGIKAFFIGAGSDDPDYPGIVKKGTVPHEVLPLWLNAADVFVLPTENEGCCNAIIEALACGLPVVSTDAPFNYDILNDSNSILVDGRDVNAVSTAICLLRDDKDLRKRLSEGALHTAAGLSITHRAERITEFIQKSLR